MAYISDLPARERLIRVRSHLLTGAPFFGALALQHCALVEDPAVETAAVDGESFFYAPAWVEAQSEPVLTGLWVHEVLHLALCHHTRRGSREPEAWNEACDYAVNPMVVAAGFTLWDGALIDPAYAGQTAEQIYAARQREKAQQKPQDAQQGAPQAQQGQGAPQAGQGQPQPGPGQAPGQPAQGQPSQGQGAGQGQPGKVLDAAATPDGNEQAAAKMESTVRQAISVAVSGAGAMPGHAAVILGELNRPRIAWTDTLARFVDDAATRVTDWNRPNRRFLDSGFFLPSSAPDSVGCVGFVLDVSGSIHKAAASALASEMQGVLDSGKVERVRLVTVSTHVTGFADYVPGDTIPAEFKGRGGTKFAPAWAHFEAHGIDPACVVYLTDLDPAPGSWGEEPPYPVLWVVYGNKRAAPFGEVLPIDPHA